MTSTCIEDFHWVCVPLNVFCYVLPGKEKKLPEKKKKKKKKELTLLNILPNKKCETSSGNFHNSYVWMAERLIYHMTPTKILKYSCLGEHWPLLYRV